MTLTEHNRWCEFSFELHVQNRPLFLLESNWFEEAGPTGFSWRSGGVDIGKIVRITKAFFNSGSAMKSRCSRYLLRAVAAKAPCGHPLDTGREIGVKNEGNVVNCVRR